MPQSRYAAPLRSVPVRSHVLQRARGISPRDGVQRRDADPVSRVREALTIPGRPLDGATRAYMEPRLGYDFSNVRVHTDDRAARSARGIGALSYTVGTDIAFAPGQYAPDTASGQYLLAHELTHVAQQSHAATDPGLTLGPIDGPAEREADAAAVGIAAGGAATGTFSAPGGVIQRSVGGIVAGVAGGVVGGALLAASLEILLREARPLSPPEIKEATKVFGSSLNYSEVRVAESTVMTLGPGRPARTPFNTIFLPPGTQKNLSFADLMPWLIHEMTHTWQTQHGISVVEKTMTALKGASAYDYGGDQGLKDAWAAGKHFLDFNTEQQADICAHYYQRIMDGGDTSPFEPFINEVKHGGLPIGSKQEPELNDGVMPPGKSMLA